MRVFLSFFLLVIFLIIPLCSSNEGFSEIQRLKPLPPSWKQVDQKSVEQYRAEEKVKDAWWPPRVSVGGGANIPDLVPLELMLSFGRFSALRFFYGPPIPFNVLVEMPSDITGKPTKTGLAIAYPATDIKLKAVYGPHYGVEFIGFPMGGTFFVSLGASLREFSVKGKAQSPFYGCSVTEAAKEPPCGNPELRIQTRTELVLGADTKSYSTLLRSAFGWRWPILEQGYVMVTFGIAKPLKTKRSMDIEASLETPGTTMDEELSDSLLELKVAKEREMEEKALTEMKPFDEKTLPIIGVTGGMRF